MHTNPLGTLHRGLRLAALSATFAGLAAAGSAQAAYIVDTGAPSGGSFNYSLYDNGTNFQFLGGGFTVGAADTITQVEGWISNFTAGSVTVALWSGAPSVASAPLFSTTQALGVDGTYSWRAFGGLSWTVGPGSYSVTFTPALGFNGNMVDGAPSPLPAYYFLNDGNADWVSYAPLGIGVRITGAVPEPQTVAMLLAGLALLGTSAARARRR